MNEPAWRVLGSRTRLENPWFRVLTRDVLLPDGSEIEFHSVDFARPAVAVVARRGGRILLIRQYRLTIDREVWAIPSGGVDPSESSIEAAARELREEAALEAGSLRPLVAYHPSYGATNQLFEVFLAEDPVDSSTVIDGNEVLETRWFSEAEVLDLIFANRIVDGLSLTPLALLFLEAAHSGPRLRGEIPQDAP